MGRCQLWIGETLLALGQEGKKQDGYGCRKMEGLKLREFSSVTIVLGSRRLSLWFRGSGSGME